jgi:hypothetical protein
VGEEVGEEQAIFTKYFNFSSLKEKYSNVNEDVSGALLYYQGTESGSSSVTYYLWQIHVTRCFNKDAPNCESHSYVVILTHANLNALQSNFFVV